MIGGEPVGAVPGTARPVIERPDATPATPATGPGPTAAILPLVGTVVAAAALGGFGPVLAVVAEGPDGRRGAAALLVVALVWATAARTAWSRPVRGAVLLVGVAAVAGWWTTPLLGRAPWIVTVALVSVALFVVRPTLPALPFRSTQPATAGPPVRVALLALPLVLAAGVVWWLTESIPAVALVALAAAATADAYARRPATVDRADRAARRAGERLRLPVAAARWDDAVHRLRGPRSRRDMWMLAAVVTGLVVRLVWVVAMTRSDRGPVPVVGDWYSTWNLRIASQFSRGEMPSLGGIHTAFWAPGLGALLAPVAWFARVTGLISLNFGASLVNVAFGTTTIVLVGALASRWWTPRASVPAMWLMALAPGHVYASSVAVPETVTTTLFLAVALALTVVVDHPPAAAAPTSRRRPALDGRLVAIGLVVGFTALVVDRAAILVLLPALTLRARRSSWRGGLRATAAVVLGALVLLVPWTIRNGVQVGWWSPTATSVAEGMCSSKYDIDRTVYTSTGTNLLMGPALDCVRHSPLDNPALGMEPIAPPGWRFSSPDEAAFASRNTSRAARWFVTHPGTLLGRAPGRFFDVVGDDSTGGLDIANHFGLHPVAGPRALQVLETLGNAWYHLVAGLAVIGLLSRRKVRAALPLWVAPLAIGLQPLLGPYGFSRHFFVAYPFLVLLAAGAWALHPRDRPDDELLRSSGAMRGGADDVDHDR